MLDTLQSVKKINKQMKKKKEKEMNKKHYQVFLKIGLLNRKNYGKNETTWKFQTQDLHRTYCRYFRVNLLMFHFTYFRPWYKCFLYNDNLPYFQLLLKSSSAMLLALQFFIFLLSSCNENFVFVSFQQKNEKRKYPDVVQIFTLSLENRFVWRQRFP